MGWRKKGKLPPAAGKHCYCSPFLAEWHKCNSATLITAIMKEMTQNDKECANSVRSESLTY